MSIHKNSAYESLTSRFLVLRAGLWGLPHRKISFQKKSEECVFENICYSWPILHYLMSAPL